MQIKILNRQYAIQGVDDEAYMHELAAYVEAKMRDIQQAGKVVDTHRLFVLAALQLADDLFQLRSRFQEMDGHVGKKCIDMIRVLDQLTEAFPVSCDPATFVE